MIERSGVIPVDVQQEPLDLSQFDDVAVPAVTFTVRQPVAAGAPTAAVATIPALVPSPRLVTVEGLSVEELKEARSRAALIDFRKPLSLINHGNGSLQELATVSRKLLADRTVGETGEVGSIAAAVLDGIKVLRLEDLQNEANGGKPTHRGGFLGRVVGFGLGVNSAIKGFTENRKKFLALMDVQEARARATMATLTTDVQLIERMSDAARVGIRELKLDIAAAQIALERGYEEEETLRQLAIATGDPADAAEVMDYRASIANFVGKATELRHSLVRSATIIPTVSSTRRAAETRIMKIGNGLLKVIPSLMAAAALAAAQADIRGAEAEGEKLEEADRQVVLLAAKGAHDVAVSAARSLGEDPRNIATLAIVAKQAIDTLNEVVQIESETAAQEREAEKKLVEIRDGLVLGMQGVQRRALESKLRG